MKTPSLEMLSAVSVPGNQLEEFMAWLRESHAELVELMHDAPQDEFVKVQAQANQLREILNVVCSAKRTLEESTRAANSAKGEF